MILWIALIATGELLEPSSKLNRRRQRVEVKGKFPVSDGSLERHSLSIRSRVNP
jgi:hypothetical protein